MKNRNAFTLVELLAVIVILGILMLIAIPNTIALIDKNKKGNYIEHAKTFVSLVQNRVQTDKALELPIDETSVLIVTLDFLKTNDISDSPYGESYDKNSSFVAILLKSNRYTYYVHLVSCNNSSNSCSKDDLNLWRGIELIEVSRLNDDDRYDLIKSTKADPNLIDIDEIKANSLFVGKEVCINDEACI